MTSRLLQYAGLGYVVLGTLLTVLDVWGSLTEVQAIRHLTGAVFSVGGAILYGIMWRTSA